ncbi:zinc-dependent metalloprotease [Chitinophaga agrisoli]|uniref:Zinc-dependent metalloprotease n=1 Tax=Chitinophaga agrisoli TaxID=2607653 RepID=A0A5B2VYI3_9BACT|nr:zinc-dependent metalloprotease [Chitinophaga agrisoli]KAA2243610.1 zinc-dependent metalloprotease [Chitinophaga agrisoli]
MQLKNFSTGALRLLLMLITVPALAQKPGNSKKADTTVKKVDTLAAMKALLIPKADAPKPYKDIIPATAITSKGFFKVHKVDEKYFFEIPDSMLERDILVVARIAKAPAELRLPGGALSFAGDEIGECVIRFQKVPGNKLFLQKLSFKERSADSTENGLYRALTNSNIQPVQAAFPIKALNDSSKSSVIEMTDYINGDNSIFFFDAALKALMTLSMQAPDRSYIEGVKAYPMNLEIKTVKTYSSRPYPITNEIKSYTYELNTSVVLLPKEPMQPRYFDPRVGFFADEFVDFDANPQGVKTESVAWRWRMEPKPGDMDKYRRGELVEPVKPIMIYIDPETPKKWVPYLIQGINDWQAAFEQAGFKNAIVGKEAPKDDSTWSIDDARHSVVVYKPSSTPNAMGPSVKDPRSGEILETHINWYHNVMDLLHKWYFVQAGAVDPRAHQLQLDDALMGQLIRFVSSHEIGHTLGLRHNFGSSSTVPVDSLRNKQWVEAHGHTPSIMDYARFNYVAQPEDHIGDKGMFPRIGDYDKWAIEWGYRYIPDAKTAAAEKETLNKWVINKLAASKRYTFGIEKMPWVPMTMLDPRNQNEDLGDDAMKAGAYGIKNLRRIEPHLMEWTREPAEDYGKAGEMYKEVLNQYERYMGHVLANIGGLLTTPRTVEQAGPVYEFVAKEKQKRAIAFLQEQLFTTPEWLNDQELFNVTETGFNMVSAVQDKVLFMLLDPKLINRLLDQQAYEPAKAYAAADMLQDLKKGIFSELAAHKPVSTNRRQLQKAYVEKLITMLPPLAEKSGVNSLNDGLSIIKAHAKTLAAEIKNASVQAADNTTRAHLEDLYERLNAVLHAVKVS